MPMPGSARAQARATTTWPPWTCRRRGRSRARATRRPSPTTQTGRTGAAGRRAQPQDSNFDWEGACCVYWRSSCRPGARRSVAAAQARAGHVEMATAASRSELAPTGLGPAPALHLLWRCPAAPATRGQERARDPTRAAQAHGAAQQQQWIERGGRQRAQRQRGGRPRSAPAAARAGTPGRPWRGARACGRRGRRPCGARRGRGRARRGRVRGRRGPGGGQEHRRGCCSARRRAGRLPGQRRAGRGGRRGGAPQRSGRRAGRARGAVRPRRGARCPAAGAGRFGAP